MSKKASVGAIVIAVLIAIKEIAAATVGAEKLFGGVGALEGVGKMSVTVDQVWNFVASLAVLAGVVYLCFFVLRVQRQFKAQEERLVRLDTRIQEGLDHVDLTIRKDREHVYPRLQALEKSVEHIGALEGSKDASKKAG